MKQVYLFSDSSLPTLPEVGGKGLSLIKMVKAGLAVPPGFVLTVSFFASWIEQLKKTPQWQSFIQSSPEELRQNCDALKAVSMELHLDSSQLQVLKEAQSGFTGKELFAVRSSSPEEDLEGASFAGGYETILGVTVDKLETAIRRAFASCLDVRVALYKKEHGFDPYSPKIAVVVQKQVASEVSGVGFSVNPITNSYDEAVFNSNWGLGETVVAGIASPDQFIVDKYKKIILDKKAGKKETSIWLTPDGGTEERSEPRNEQLTLSDDQVLALSEQIVRIDQLYGKPMDIEWAFAEGKLYLLQARPITTFFPLPDEMITPPGKHKRLYFDVTLTVQGLAEPMTVMATSVLALLIHNVSNVVLGRDITKNIDETVPFAREGKLYLNLSNILVVAHKEKLASVLKNVDYISSEGIKTIDEAEYRSESQGIKKLPLLVLGHAPDIPLKVLAARFFPEAAKRTSEKGIEEGIKEIKELNAENLPLEKFIPQLFGKAAHVAFHYILPFLISGRLAIGKIKTVFENNQEAKEYLDHLDRSLPGNVTIEMGLALYNLSLLLTGPESLSLKALEQGIKNRTISPAFLKEWENFLEKYGFRGYKELDISSPRYRDQPGMLLQQLVQLKLNTDPVQTPLAIYEKSRNERLQAYEKLSKIAAKLGRRKSKKFHALYKVIETFGGIRETPKYYIIMCIDLLRQRVLPEADKLVAAGRLDSREQVFDLTWQDLLNVISDSSIDVPKLREERTRFFNKLKLSRNAPTVIDSRGKIIRPVPPPAKEGELSGQAISIGTVQGRVKVLHTPDEKPLLPGDILVAKATDPGWTPLFINAAAVVLEVGGMLQHGALVAREYGKPCVAGIDRATELLKDNMLIEVDGTSGIIRILEQPAEQAVKVKA
jgi:phosphoenolpyruvate synthase/pyruvate phosphate dikinase